MYKHNKNLQANANPPINSDYLTISLLQRLKGTHPSKAWSPYIKNITEYVSVGIKHTT